MRGITFQDARAIRLQMDESFFLVIGGREDRRLLEMIPLAENVMVSSQICLYCKSNASFSSISGRAAVCRGCKKEEADRMAKIDGNLQEGIR